VWLFLILLTFFLHTDLFLKMIWVEWMHVVKSLLGMDFTWENDKSWLRIDHPHAIDNMPQGSGVELISKFTPLPPGTEVHKYPICPDLDTDDGRKEAALVKTFKFRRRVGEALWIARTSRHDCMAAVIKLSTVANNPGMTTHIKQQGGHSPQSFLWTLAAGGAAINFFVLFLC
jgi:hypothetical protein